MPKIPDPPIPPLEERNLAIELYIITYHFSRFIEVFIDGETPSIKTYEIPDNFEVLGRAQNLRVPDNYTHSLRSRVYNVFPGWNPRIGSK